MRPLGYQLASSRKFFPLIGTLEMVSNAGYSYVEGHADLFRSPVDLAELAIGLSQLELEMPTAHFALAQVQDDSDRMLEVAKRFDLHSVVIARLAEPLRPRTAIGWTSFGHMLSEAAKPFLDAGIRVAYHNYDYDVVTIEDGVRPLDLILDVDDTLDLQFDPAWAHRAGVDPVEMIKTYADRIKMAHIKDVAAPGRNVEENGWADVCAGVLDWRKLWLMMDDLDLTHRIVEHGDPSDHWRFSRESFKAVEALEDLSSN